MKSDRWRARPDHLLRRHDLKREDVNHSILWLRGSLISDVGGAVSKLEEIRGRANYLSLYREFFPKEWARSTAPFVPTDEEVRQYRHESGDEGWPHSPRELEFFRLVDQHLFPLPIWQLDDASTMWGKLPHLPLYSDWIDDDPADFDPALRLAGALITQGSWETIDALAADLTHGRVIAFDPPPNEQDAKTSQVKRAFARRRAPLRYFYEAWCVMSGTTGNALIDPSCMCGQCDVYDWTSEDIRHLAAAQKEQAEIMSRIHQLDRWMRSDPAKSIGTIIRIWNRATR